MPQEPTAAERQRIAFDLLKNEARTAHREGDGLRVIHLCETCLQEVQRLVKSEKLVLHLTELQWAFIFQLYWLLHTTPLGLLREVLRQIPKRDEADQRIFTTLEAYFFLIEQPLLGGDQTFQRLNAIPPSSFGDEFQPESAELVTHLIELAWFHLVADDRWRKVAAEWVEKGPGWVKNVVGPVEERLMLQTRLTVPSKRHPPLSADAAASLRKVSDLAELWVLQLNGQNEVLLARIKQLSPRLSPDAYQWRLMADFWHMNRLFGGGDSQNVWLARRRQMTTKFPVLFFHDRRELRMRELLAEVYRRRGPGSAYQRWGVLQLAMLHELAALRIWDFGMWREAVQAQSETLLEASQWMDAMPELTAQGLVIGVRAISLQSPEKDFLVQSAIQHVEFASEQVLQSLAEDLFWTYPTQGHTAAELFAVIGDLVPASLWLELAEWSVGYATRSRSGHQWGSKINPLEHWINIVPSLESASDAWKILGPEVIALGRISHCWRGKDSHLLYSWLAWAPIASARDLGQALVDVAATDLGDSFFRAKLICSVEDDRSELGKSFSAELFQRAQLPEERLLLAEHLNDQSVNELTNEVHERTVRAIRSALQRAAPSTDAKDFSFGTFVPGLNVLKNWDGSEDLVRELIATINSPNVLQDWLPWLLSTLQILVADGPASVSQIVKPEIATWAKKLPSGRTIVGDVHGPFSIIQSTGTSAGDVAEMLGWLCFQILRQLNSAAHSEVREWLQQTLLNGYVEPMGVALYVSVILASQSSEDAILPILVAADATLLTLRTSMSNSVDARSTLADALWYIAGITRQQTSEFVDWRNPVATLVLAWLTRLLCDYAPIFTKAPHPAVRAAFAAVVWNLSQWNPLSDELASSFERLKRDQRARVRFEAYGGWKEKRKNTTEQANQSLD